METMGEAEFGLPIFLAVMVPMMGVFFTGQGGVVCPYGATVDGSEILHQLRLVVYPIIIYKVLYIPVG